MTEVVPPSPASSPEPANVWLARGVALVHLGLLGAGEVTRLTAEMHATIRRTPLPWKASASAPAEKAPLPYLLVMNTFRHLARLTRQFLQAHEPVPASRPWGMFRSILNGVAGDAVSDWDNPLQQQMMLCNDAGDAITADEWGQQGRKGAVLFIHGLCLSDREWHSPQHLAFVRELRESGHAVAWLRYNTGRPVHENGEALSVILESLRLEKRGKLTLVGHSMGGLVIRAATHHARQTRQQWLLRLQQAAYLGTPHLGAPLERIGHGANSLLGLTPYTRPLMKLGNLRSAGIMDLRHGRVTPPDHDHDVELHEDARHLLVAGHLGRSRKRHWLGDGLVPVRSALGQHVETDKALGGKQVTRVELPALGHMAMLDDERVYSALRDWLQKS